MVEHSENSMPALAHLLFTKLFEPFFPSVSVIHLYKVDFYKSKVYSKTQVKAKCMGNVKIY